MADNYELETINIEGKTIRLTDKQLTDRFNAEVTNRENADTALQGQITAEVTNRENADTALQGQITAEVTNRETADATLQSQINQIIAPSGEAPSAAEVQNARIGSDGTVYPTLGDAIRTQNSNLKSALSEKTSNDVELFSKVFDTIHPLFISGKELTITNGSMYDNAKSMATNFYEVKAGSTIVPDEEVVAIVCRYSSNNKDSFISGNSYLNARPFCCDENCYIRVSIKYRDGSAADNDLSKKCKMLLITSNNIEQHINEIEQSLTGSVYSSLPFTNGKWIDINNGRTYDNARSIATTEYVFAKAGSSIKVDSDVECAVAQYSSGSLETFISGGIFNDFTVTTDCYIRVAVRYLEASKQADDALIAKCIFKILPDATMREAIANIEDDISGINERLSGAVTGFSFKVGGLNAQYGEESDSPVRARTDYIYLTKGSVIKTNNDTYRIAVFEFVTQYPMYYTQNQSNINFVNEYEVNTDDVSCIRIVAKRVDNANITASDLEELSKCISVTPVLQSMPIYSIENVPSEIFTTTSVPFDAHSDMTYDEVIAGYDRLVSEYPEYVRKNILGPDSSGDYTVYQYIFEPQVTSKVTYNYGGKTYNVTKEELPTIILEAGVHGAERPSVKGLLNAMTLICSNWQNSDVLAFLRYNFRIVVNPCAVPWGYVKGSRFNARGVNINRNFDGMGQWQYGSDKIGDVNYRGSAPLSEIEAQYIHNTLEQNKNAVLYFSYHTYGLLQSYVGMMCWAWATYVKPNEMWVAGENIAKQVSRVAWSKHNYPYSEGKYICQMQASNGIRSQAKYRGGYTCNEGNAFGIPSACPEGIYYKYGNESTANSTDINCINAEFVVITVIETLKQILKA